MVTNTRLSTSAHSSGNLSRAIIRGIACCSVHSFLKLQAYAVLQLGTGTVGKFSKSKTICAGMEADYIFPKFVGHRRRLPQDHDLFFEGNTGRELLAKQAVMQVRCPMPIWPRFGDYS